MMLTLATAELALGLVNATLGLGHRVDEIRLKTAIGESLPFALPSLPEDLGPLMQPAIDYFRDDAAGREVIDFDKLADEFTGWASLAESGGVKPTGFSALNSKYVHRYAVLNGVIVRRVGDQKVPAHVGRGIWLAAAMVASSMPGVQRSEFMNIVLATADVALEFAGANPGLITKNSKVQGVISTFLQKFTGGNLEDLSYRQFFDRTLSSLLSTAVEHRELIDEKAVALFLDSLNDVAKTDPDFTAGLVAGRGFDKLLRAVLSTAGKDIARFTDDEFLRTALGGFLQQVASDAVFSRLRLDGDSLPVLAQVAIERVARYPKLLQSKGGGKLWNAVLKSVVKHVGELAGAEKLFTPDTIASLTGAALSAIGENPELIDKGLVGKLVAGIADAVQQAPITELFSPTTLRTITQEALSISANNTGLLIRNNGFAEKVLAAVLQAGAKGFDGGFRGDLAVELFRAAASAALTNVDLLGMPLGYSQIVAGVVNEFARNDLGGLLQGNLLDAFGRVLKVVAANPRVWEQVGGWNLPAAVLRSLADAFATDPTMLVRGPVLADAAEGILRAVARRAKAYAEVVAGKIPGLSLLLTEAMKRLEGELGHGLSAENIVAVLTRLILDWGEQKFIVDAADLAFRTRVGELLALS